MKTGASYCGKGGYLAFDIREDGLSSRSIWVLDGRVPVSVGGLLCSFTSMYHNESELIFNCFEAV